jgi:hypothetical protein
MELVVIYFVTRLTALKGALDVITVVSCVLMLASIIGALINEFATDIADKDAEPVTHTGNGNVFMYQGFRRSSRRSLRYLIPIFVVSFMANILLPTSRDAVTIAGGYGLVEAVKSDRVQRLFHKSSQVATSWLDAQIGSTPSTGSAASAVAASVAGTAASSVSTSSPGQSVSPSPAASASDAIGAVTGALGTVQKLGDAASQVQGAIAAVRQTVQQ